MVRLCTLLFPSTKNLNIWKSKIVDDRPFWKPLKWMSLQGSFAEFWWNFGTVMQIGSDNPTGYQKFEILKIQYGILKTTRIPSGLLLWSRLYGWMVTIIDMPSASWQLSVSSQHMVKSLSLNPYNSLFNLKFCTHIWSTNILSLIHISEPTRPY